MLTVFGAVKECEVIFNIVLTNCWKCFLKWVGQIGNGSRGAQWIPTQNTCGVFLAKRNTDKTVFKVLHSFKVFSTNKTVWIWRSGVLLCQQTDIGHAQAMPSISFFFLTTTLILHPRRVCCHKSHTPHRSHNSDGAKHPETEEETRAAPTQLVHRWPWTWSIWRCLTLFCTLPSVTALHYRGWEQ